MLTHKPIITEVEKSQTAIIINNSDKKYHWMLKHWEKNTIVRSVY